MEKPRHSLSALFDQLGLPSDDKAIESFIKQHRPMPEHLALADAPFWQPSQKAMLKQAWCDDADWVEVVDELSMRLR